MEQIGKDIDFLILDTSHCLPGELLDFIVCLPYLKNGCIVVLHDTIENHMTCIDLEIATKLLFDVVTANDKYMMREEETNVAEFPNITAFRVGEETRRNVRDLFSIMTVTWGYLLEESDKQWYRNSILQNYGREYLDLFDRVEILQRYTNLQRRITIHYGKNIEYLKMKWKNSEIIYIYGAGYYAELYFQWAALNGFDVMGFVISDDQEKKADNYMETPIYHLSELSCEAKECAIIIATDPKHQNVILKNLKRSGYYNIL